MDGLDLDLQRLHQPGQPRRLTERKLEDQSPEGGRVHHRVLQRPGEPAAQDPGVEGIVAVLDEDRAPREVEKGAARVAELGRVDQHLPLDQVCAWRRG